ncbi:MAG: translation initiation factor IF-2 [Verrucomicrobia bacterium]|nr:MAG: translation initiation factor IF-2 [Verrucomicrobiota bacterium]
MRVHELARELGLRSSKDVLDKLLEHGMQLKNHMSPLTEEQEALVRQAFPSGSAAQAASQPVAAPEKKTVLVRGPIIVKEFAEQLGLKPNQLIAEMMMMNIFASINERIDLKIAQQLAEKHGAHLEHEKKQIERKPVTKAAEPAAEPTEDRVEELATRPPIVTFMGHVDHGKTSLLDKIRNAKVAASEDGGITQHIGAYTVTLNDRQITFLDTPGHAAFTQMRARGANMTDIAIIVIAADDGIMPQTREAIQHARAAKVAIMVAINKTDLRGANVDRVKQQLQKEELAPEDWGGTTICCPVSAVTGAGIDHLLEMILLQADMLELKSNPTRRAQGYVIEARLEPGMGPTANILVKRGTLKVGDAITCGPYWGRVKALISDKGIKVRTATPSMAVKVLGLTAVPEPGMEFQVQANDRVARDMSEKACAEKREQEIAVAPKRLTLDDLMRPAAAQAKDARKLRIILKADVQGSLEAIQNALAGIKSDKVQLDILLTGVGNVSSNDVLLARASEAIIVGFHVSKDDGVNAVAKREGVEIRLYSIIYELLDEVRNAMVGLLEPVVKQTVVGHAEVLQVFEISKKGKIAGCRCTDGRITSRSRARIKRKGEVLFEGALNSLKRFQNDAAEVREGQECGLRLDHFSDFQVGDVIECFEIEKIAQQL